MISAIIFDFGGVLSVGKFFPVVAEQISKKYGVPQDVLQKRMYEYESEFTLGHKTAETFWKEISDGTPFPYEGFLESFFTYTLNDKVLELIRALKERYMIVLHSDNFDPTSGRIRTDERLMELFTQERMYFSNEMHFSKTDERSFRFILEHIGKRPDEVVFIDDKERNLVIPKQIGMNTICFSDTEALRQELQTLGVQ